MKNRLWDCGLGPQDDDHRMRVPDAATPSESDRRRQLLCEVEEYGAEECVIHREELLGLAVDDVDWLLRDLRDLGLPPQVLRNHLWSALKRVLRDLG